MKKTVLFIVMCMSFISLMAQDDFDDVVSVGAVSMSALPWMQAQKAMQEAAVVDISKFVAIYNYSCKTQDADGTDVTDSKKLALQVGMKINRCYSYIDYQREFATEKKEVKEYFLIKADESYTFVPEVWVNLPEGKITTREGVCPNMYEATGKRPAIKWALNDEVIELCGYQCKSASGELNGKKWTVYYTEEIPTTAGPWKLGGLPGLIVKATDDENVHVFKLESLEEVATPIRYSDDASYIKITDKKMTEFRNKTFGNDQYAQKPTYYIPDFNAIIKTLQVYNDGDKEALLLNNNFFLKEHGHVYKPLELK